MGWGVIMEYLGSCKGAESLVLSLWVLSKSLYPTATFLPDGCICISVPLIDQSLSEHQEE